MADNSTVARPYAKAIFEFALEHKKISEWSETLQALTQIVSDPLAAQLIHNPASTPDQQSELLLSTLLQLRKSTEKEFVGNLLQLLAQNARLLALPNIAAQFEALRADHEKTLVVDVISYTPLSNSQEALLVKRLNERLQRSVTLQVTIDKTLNGGAIIRAGHLVYDASVKTQLKKLGASLAI